MKNIEEKFKEYKVKTFILIRFLMCFYILKEVICVGLTNFSKIFGNKAETTF